MKALLIIFIIVMPASIVTAQETKTIAGRIISEDLEPLPRVKVYNMDTIVLGSTDLNGYFKIEIPTETNELLLGFIGMEWTSVKFEEGCQNLEIIMMIDVIYDFIPIKRINRKRRRRYKKLLEKHLKAYKKGIFETKTPCVCYIFTEY